MKFEEIIVHKSAQPYPRSCLNFIDTVAAATMSIVLGKSNDILVPIPFMPFPALPKTGATYLGAVTIEEMIRYCSIDDCEAVVVEQKTLGVSSWFLWVKRIEQGWSEADDKSTKALIEIQDAIQKNCVDDSSEPIEKQTMIFSLGDELPRLEVLSHLQKGWNQRWEYRESQIWFVYDPSREGIKQWRIKIRTPE